MSKKKKEISKLRADVRNYRTKAIDALLDDRYHDYAFWIHSAMIANDKVMTMTGFKQRGQNAKKTRTIYVPVKEA